MVFAGKRKWLGLDARRAMETTLLLLWCILHAAVYFVEMYVCTVQVSVCVGRRRAKTGPR